MVAVAVAVVPIPTPINLGAENERFIEDNVEAYPAPPSTIVTPETLPVEVTVAVRTAGETVISSVKNASTDGVTTLDSFSS